MKTHLVLFTLLALAAPARADVECLPHSLSGHFLNDSDNICEIKELDAQAVKTISEQDGRDSLCVSFAGETTTVAQLRSLAKLPWLRCVQVTGVVDLTPLKALKQLRRLDVNAAGLADLKFLAALPPLETLQVQSDNLVDLKGLASQPKLRRLQLTLSADADLLPVGALHELRRFELYGVGDKVGATVPVEKLTNLEVLVMSALPDLRRIAGLTHLRQLAVYDEKKVADLTPLAGLTALETLELDRTSVADLHPLAKLTKLTELDLSQTKVKDITPLGGLAALHTLWLDETPVTDISVVAKLPALEWLRIDRTGVKDLRPVVAIAKHLQNLSLPQGVDGKAVYAANPNLVR